MRGFIIAGTDTNVGKTIFSAGLADALQGFYWKPLQCGVEDGGDARVVQNLSSLPQTHILPEAYKFAHALSPHRAAELEGQVVDIKALTLPCCHGPLIVEAAGGVMVPMTRDRLQIDLFSVWNLPVILCARTGLGTINHTLLSLEALKARHIPVYGIVFIGDENADTIRTIADFSGVRVLGRLPWLEILNREILKKMFDENFVSTLWSL